MSLKYIDSNGNEHNIAGFGRGTGGVPIGSIFEFAGSTAPTGYMICDGSAISRLIYAELFAAIGTTYGQGDGSTTFNLPDIQGRVPVGRQDGNLFNYLGTTGGEVSHTLTVDEMPSHNHSYDKTTGSSANDFDRTLNRTGIISVSTTSTSTGNKGSGLAHNNLQPYIVLNYIIRVSADIAENGNEVSY